MPTRRHASGRTVARKLRRSAAPLRQDPYASVRRAADAGRSQDRRSVYLQFVRRLWLMVS